MLDCAGLVDWISSLYRADCLVVVAKTSICKGPGTHTFTSTLLHHFDQLPIERVRIHMQSVKKIPLKVYILRVCLLREIRPVHGYMASGEGLP